ncbi:glucose PTS transporter subunit IIA [Corynebacterium argentoratense]|uniref:glucose PTS transporter subunit IIA n=1 Tax=Corynebacterium argentoratense TaxID=42817 RepID=UPI001F237C03|nr:glucose PTS transporter subunit IIA [Corynebacterium argentoratense]MCF1765395.1 glucose PTS transporter subunit IIA [Corynebacterium argentoratense]
MPTNTATVSQFILDKVGGAENVTNLTHCATRLRFQLADQSKADIDALDNNDAVMGVVPQGSTGLQVIMGGGVAEYYAGIKALPGMADSDAKAASSKKEYGGVRGKYSWIDYGFEVLSDTFRPILWALLGASLIITMLVLADTFGLQDFRAENQPPTYQFMHAMWRSVFYFLPIMVGATAARKLGANEWVGAAIPAALLTPEFLKFSDPEYAKGLADISEVAGRTVYTYHVFGLPMVINDYGGQVFPPLIAAVALFFVEKLFKKIIPSAVHMVFVPFFSLLVMIPATAFVFGPIGIGVGNGISHFLEAVNNWNSFVLAIIIPLLYPFLVPLGLHWPLNAIMLQNINSLGYDFIQGPMGAWNFACFGVVTGVFVMSIREKNTTMRQVSLGGALAGLLGGISEPSLYGVLLRFRRSYISLLPGCALGGAVMGFFNVKASAFVFTSLLTIPAMSPMLGYMVGIAVAFFTSFFLVIALDYRTKEEKAEVLAKLAAERGNGSEAVAAEAADVNEVVETSERVDAAEDAVNNGGNVAAAAAGADAATAVAAKPAKPLKPAMQPGAETVISSPMEGTCVALSEVPDAGFASGAVGKGVAIEPTGDSVYAPADGVVAVAFPTGHAVALKLDSGVELLMHVGVDTVNMKGDGFQLHVKQKQRVSKGDKLITFDRDKIAAAGYPAITPVLVTNHKKFGSVEGMNFGTAGLGTDVIKVSAKDA